MGIFEKSVNLENMKGILNLRNFEFLIAFEGFFTSI
jgi:hypothetical protein